MKKEKDEYYIKEMHAYHAVIMRPIFGKWEIIKRFFRFLNDPACIHLDIEKSNNYKIKDTQWFDKDHNLIDDLDGILTRDGKIDENGNLITKRFGKLTKKL